MSKKNVHVVTHPEGWAAKKEGNTRASSVHDTQREAIAAARKLAINEKSELVIHGRDNKIRDKDSYGPDPNPPRDKRH